MANMSTGVTPEMIFQPNRFQFCNITEVLHQSDVSSLVEQIKQNYYTISIADALQGLKDLGPSLQTALEASNGFSCHVKIVPLCKDYESFLGDSLVTILSIFRDCKNALGYHWDAYELAKSDEFKGSLHFFNKCSVAAEAMAIKSGMLAQAAYKLRDESVDALTVAVQNEIDNDNQKKEIGNQILELEKQEAILGKHSKGLSADVREKQTKIEKLETDEKRVQWYATLTGLATPVALLGIGAGLSTVLSPATVTTIMATTTMPVLINQIVCSFLKSHSKIEEILREINKTNSELEHKKMELIQKNREPEKNGSEIKQLELEIVDHESKIAQLKNEHAFETAKIKKAEEDYQKTIASLQAEKAQSKQELKELRKNQIEVDASLAGIVKQLSGLNNTASAIGKAVITLVEVKSNLGKVASIFENARVHWLAVKEHCDDLALDIDLQVVANSGMKHLYVEKLIGSALNWFALGTVVHKAGAAMDHVKNELGPLMNFKKPRISEIVGR